MILYQYCQISSQECLGQVSLTMDISITKSVNISSDHIIIYKTQKLMLIGWNGNEIQVFKCLKKCTETALSSSHIFFCKILDIFNACISFKFNSNSIKRCHCTIKDDIIQNYQKWYYSKYRLSDSLNVKLENCSWLYCLLVWKWRYCSM